MDMRTKTSVTVLAAVLAAGPGRAEPKVGAAAPDFTLRDVDGKEHKLSDAKGRYVVMEWTNFDCPFVKKHYAGNMQRLQKTYTAKDVVWLTVNSSAPGKSGNYTAEAWRNQIKAKEAAPTAMLLDPDGTVGRTYGAKSTPHMFVINPEGTLIYKGAIDDDRSADPRKTETAKNYVAAALEAAMAGKPVAVGETQAYGCSVKY